MEGSGGNGKGKRIRNEDEEDDKDDYNLSLASIQEEIPAFVSVMLEALKKDNPNDCPCLKLIKGKITYEQLHHGNLERLLGKTFNYLLHILGTNNPGTLAGGSVVVPSLMSSPPRILGSGGQKLQLRFKTRMPTYLFSGENVEGEGGSVICVELIDPSNDIVVQTGPAAAAKLNVVVLEGHFNEEISDGWTHEVFKGYQVKEREGKRPILVGDLQVTLKGGVGILGDLSFTDNSSWTKSKKFRLGVELASGFYGGIHVMEGKTNALRVKDLRGKAYKKHCPPALHDKVWRLKCIAKDGPLHKSLLNAEIRTVEDILRLHAKDRQRLRTILGKGMTEKMWETTIKHARTFSPSGGKVYVFYTDGTKSSGIILDHIHEPIKLITNREVVPLESLDQTQKIAHLAKKAYENWHQVVECDAQYLSSFITSVGMQDCPAEQTYCINHKITPTQTGHTFQPVQQIQPDYAYVPQQSLEPPLQIQPDYAYVPQKSLEPPLQIQLDYAYVPQQSLEPPLQIQPDYASVPQQSLEPPFSSSDPEKLSPQNNWTGGLEDFCLRSPIEFLYFPGMEAEPHFERPLEGEPVYSTGKAVVGWLKIKVALKWGIMVRNRAARKRAKLTELD